MDITPLLPEGAKIIQAYASGQFRVAGDVFKHAVIVFPDDVISWDKDATEPFCVSDFQAVLDRADDVDVLFLGCGRMGQQVSQDLRDALSAKGIIIEVMDSAAACRTYNVLMAEGRKVVAALLPV